MHIQEKLVFTQKEIVQTKKIYLSIYTMLFSFLVKKHVAVYLGNS